jgi:hypothetical protein
MKTTLDRTTRVSTAARCEDRFSFAAVGSAVRCGNRYGKVSGRWEFFAVVQFEDGATERVPLNRLFEPESGA